MEQNNLPIRSRSDLADIPPYKQGLALSGGYKISSNENPFAPLPEVQEAYKSVSDRLARYGTPPFTDLRTKIANTFGGEAAGVTVDNVHLSAGSVMTLVQLLHAVAGAGDNFVYPWPSFEGYPSLGVIAGAEARPVPLRPDCGHDIDAMIAATDDRTRAIILCSPNNPTGNILTRAEFNKLISSVPSDVLVILDEAYIEFVSDEDSVRGEEELGKYPNLVVLRTFSKAYGLATLRLGYGVGHPEIWKLATTIAIPLAISLPAEAAASRILDDDLKDKMQARFDEISRRREYLLAGVRKLGIDVPPSQSNFIWIPQSEKWMPEKIAAAFAERGTSVRAFIGKGTRITVGEEESLDHVLEVLGTIAGE